MIASESGSWDTLWDWEDYGRSRTGRLKTYFVKISAKGVSRLRIEARHQSNFAGITKFVLIAKDESKGAKKCEDLLGELWTKG